jgi:transcriptional regulator with XRE-family HTH domain
LTEDDPAQLLARAVEQARLEQGLSKHDLARLARVARPTISLLINHGKIPSRAATLDRIGAALGWETGTCAALLAGQPAPGPCPPATRSAKLVAQRLTEIAEEARSAAAAVEQSVLRLKTIEDRARAAARFVLGGSVAD